MADRSALEAAAAAGLIGVDQVAPLHDFLSSRAAGAASDAAPAAPTGEEELRFIRNFHDVFLATGIVLLAIGLGVGISVVSPQFESIPTAACWLGSAGILWLLGEMFARRRRLFLPAIAVCVTFVLFVVLGAAGVYASAIGDIGPLQIDDLDLLSWAQRAMPGAVASAGLAAAIIFYLRFRLPFSMGVIGATAAAAAAAYVFALAPQWSAENAGALMLALGLGLFLASLWFDTRDPNRTSRLSDNGFWLHLAAAPLILNGALYLADTATMMQDYQSARWGGNWQPASAQDLDAAKAAAATRAAITLAIVGVLGLVSLLINRRALIVSALLTTGIAIGILMNTTGAGAGAVAAGTLVALGGFVLVIGASWHAMRRVLLRWVKPDGVWARIFPPKSAPL